MSEKLLKVFVEVPKGSRNKYEYNPQTGDSAPALGGSDRRTR